MIKSFLNKISNDNEILYANIFKDKLDIHLNDKHFTKQQNFDLKYLRIANIWSENSYSTRSKVGAILVKNNTIISDGFNGTPTGFSNICEDDNGNTKPEVLHAEANCISKVAKSHNSSENSTMYCTMSPCLDCAKMIIQSQISEIVFCELYRTTLGLELLYEYGQCNIKYYKLF